MILYETTKCSTIDWKRKRPTSPDARTSNYVSNYYYSHKRGMIFDLNQNALSFRHQLSRHDEGKLFLGRIRGSLFWHVAATNVIYTIPFFITRSDVFFFYSRDSATVKNSKNDSE